MKFLCYLGKSKTYPSGIQFTKAARSIKHSKAAKLNKLINQNNLVKITLVTYETKFLRHKPIFSSNLNLHVSLVHKQPLGFNNSPWEKLILVIKSISEIRLGDKLCYLQPQAT